MKTLKEIINYSKEFVDDNLSFEEIKWLLLDTFSLQEYQLISLKEKEFDDEEYLKKLKLAKKIPVSYLLNYQIFFGYKFYVDNNVLIPRNETEELVEHVLNYIFDNNYKNIKILEIGTGSGCIAISLKKELDKRNINSFILAVDISQKALEIAKKNAFDNNANIDFILSDCLDNVTNDDFDIVVSNPPYINKDNYVSKRVLDNEPHLALFAEDKGLAIYKKIFLQIKKFSFLKAVFFEISPDLKSDLENIKNNYLPQFHSQYLLDINKYVRFAIYLKY